MDSQWRCVQVLEWQCWQEEMKTKCKGAIAEMEDDYNEDDTEVDNKYTNDT